MMMKTAIAALALACSAAPFAASAALISTLYNTGVDNAGAPLANATTPDPHYALVSVPGGSSTVTRVIDPAGGFPLNGAYFVGGNASRWIVANNPSTDPNAGDSSPVGSYTFRTTFDLSGYDFSSASISGGWSTDNNGLDILINGVSLGYTTSNTQFIAGFAAFSVNSGFVAGINTLDFVVVNGNPGQTSGSGGPIGLRVEMTGNADLNRVSEPAPLALAAIALLVAVTRRHAAARRARP